MKGYPTVFNRIIFIESELPEMQRVAEISVDLSFRLGAQLKNLNDVKSELSVKAQQQGCNCIANFKYGQKSRWLAIDDVAFFGSGTAGRLSDADYTRIIDYIAQRDSQ
jgi:hypothetical protein